MEIVEEEESNSVEEIEPEKEASKPSGAYSVVKSSVDDLDVNVINKYLSGSKKQEQSDYKNGEDEEEVRKEPITEKIMFKKLVANLASKETSSSDDSSSSSGSEELVYEEVSVSPGKKSSHKKKKKEKKKHHHKKKSKKSHKKSKK